MSLYAKKIDETIVDKKLAAAEKRKATIERKKQLALENKEKQQADDLEKQKALEDAWAKKQEKLRIAREKRKAKKEAVPPTITPPPSDVSVVHESPKQEKRKIEPQEKPVKKIKIDQENEPPVWFSKYLEGVKQEENLQAHSPKAKRVIKKEAVKESKEQWSQGIVRDRINNEVNSHLHRMYSQIFGRRN